MHGKSNVEAVLFNILREKYPQSISIQLCYQLDSLKQADFLTIKEFLSGLEFFVNRLAIAKGWGQDLIDEKKEERFFAGLSDRTKLEMVNLRLYTINDILRTITEVEETLIQQILNKPDTFNREYNNNFREFRKNQSYHRKHNNYPYQKPYNKQNYSISNQQWFSYHQTNSHSANTCRANKRHPKNREGKENPRNDTHHTNKRSNETRNFLLTEKQRTLKQINLPAKINNCDVNCLLDTGSEKTIISSSYIQKLKRETKQIPKLMCLQSQERKLRPPKKLHSTLNL